MAVSAAKILIGAATVSIGDWVTAAGAGSLVDVGHTKAPATITPNFEHVEITSERAVGALKLIPIDGSYSLKVSILEGVLANFQLAAKNADGNVTGTPPDLIFEVGEAAERYHQITLTGIPGVGTTSVRTITIWRAAVESVAEVSFGKGVEQMLEVTFRILHDDSVSALGKFMKIVDI